MIKASLTHLAKNEGVVIPMAICISIRTRFRFFWHYLLTELVGSLFCQGLINHASIHGIEPVEHYLISAVSRFST